MDPSSSPQAPPVPPHTIKFIQSVSPKTLTKILSSWSVKLDAKAFNNPSPSTRAELERRVKLLLSDSQRLAVVLPKSKTTYAALPRWTGSRGASNRTRKPGTGPMGSIYSKCFSFGQLFGAQGNSENLPSKREVGEDVYTDACQTLISIAHGYDISFPVFTLQDTRQTSAISLRIVEAKTTLLDKKLPLVFVLFYHETREHATMTSPALQWLQNIQKISGESGIHSVTSPLDEQHLILRQLIYNSRRLPPGCESMFEATRNKLYEKDFIPSFLLPLDPLSHSGLENLNRNDKCAECGLPASTLCGTCCVIYYCSSTCQRKNRAAHKQFCTRIATSARSVTVHVAAKRAFQNIPSAVSANFSMNMSQRDMLRDSAMNTPSLVNNEGVLKSLKRRGTKERFIVKMQVPLVTGGDLMVYDAERTFQIFIERERDPEALKELMELARGSVRWGGLKIFLYARHVEGEGNREKLEISTGVLPDQEQFW